MIINWNSGEEILEKVQTIWVFKKDRLYFVSYRTFASGDDVIDDSYSFFELYVIPEEDCDLTCMEIKIQECMNDGKQDTTFNWCNVQIMSWKHIDIPRRFLNEIKNTK